MDPGLTPGEWLDDQWSVRMVVQGQSLALGWIGRMLRRAGSELRLKPVGLIRLIQGLINGDEVCAHVPNTSGLRAGLLYQNLVSRHQVAFSLFVLPLQDKRVPQLDLRDRRVGMASRQLLSET